MILFILFCFVLCCSGCSLISSLQRSQDGSADWTDPEISSRWNLVSLFLNQEYFEIRKQRFVAGLTHFYTFSLFLRYKLEQAAHLDSLQTQRIKFKQCFSEVQHNEIIGMIGIISINQTNSNLSKQSFVASNYVKSENL